MGFRQIDEARFFRWFTPLLLSALIIVGLWAMPYYLRGEFTTKMDGDMTAQVLAPLPEKITKVEATIEKHQESFAPLPSKVASVEREVEALKPLPGRVQLLEAAAVNQTALNARRDAQIEALVNTLNTLATQQSVTISKIDDLNRRNERMENKLDTVNRKIE